jgi:Flp pilus assembly CpaE family ATPase
MPDDAYHVNRAANEGRLLVELARRSSIAQKLVELAKHVKPSRGRAAGKAAGKA